MAVGREREGDAKFKAYLNLLASIVNVQVVHHTRATLRHATPTLIVGSTRTHAHMHARAHWRNITLGFMLVPHAHTGLQGGHALPSSTSLSA